MSRYLVLQSQPAFAPLIKITKARSKYVEDLWHHAVLTLFGFIPSNDNRYNDMDIEDSEILYIARTYGIRSGLKYDPYKHLSDEELYALAISRAR